MDISFPIFPTILALLIFLPMILKASRRKSGAEKLSPNLPPGPPKLPIIGNLHQLFGSLPHHILGDMAKKYGPIFHLQLGEVSTVVVSTPELAQEVMRTHDVIFANRPSVPSQNVISYNGRDIVSAPYGDYWRQLRKLCTIQLLSHKRIQSYEPIRERVVSDMVQTIASRAGSVVNLSKLIYSAAIQIIMKSAFGEKCQVREDFIQVVHRTTEVTEGMSLSDHFPSKKFLFTLTGMKSQCEKVLNDTNNILNGVIEEHRSRKREGKGSRDEHEAEDLLQILLDIQEKGDPEIPLTLDDIKGVVMDVFVAGAGTSASTVEWTMSELMRNPRIMEKAQAEVRAVFGKKGKVDEAGLEELTYVKSVIKEDLRVHIPLPLLIPRESTEKCELGGFNLPPKTRVIINGWSTGRDPNYWKEPEKFYPERFLGSPVDYKGHHFEFVPFGAGRRICPGVSFGIMNVELLLSNLLYHFDWKLPYGMKPEELDMTEKAGLTVMRKHELFITPTPHLK